MRHQTESETEIEREFPAYYLMTRISSQNILK